ncbi:MAG: aldolase [bacterium]|nr:aldolase [bacterium]
MNITRVVLLLTATAVLSPLGAQGQWENPVKVKLREGKPVAGATITIPSAEVAVDAANLGYDFLWIEMEHSAITLETARDMILATRGTGTVPFVRVPINELWTAKRALDIGALGVIFPFTNSVELARQAVAACRYPPAGQRGYGTGLWSLRWPVPGGGFPDFADKNVMVVIMIEKTEAVEKIDEIAAIPGIDVIFIGPADLSMSMGLRGRRTKEHEQAMAKVLAAAKRRGLPSGLPAGAADLADRIQQGFRFFQTSSDLRLMAAGAQPILEAVGKKPADPSARPLY